MGGVGGLIDPGGGGLDLDALEALLLDSGDKADIHILGKNIFAGGRAFAAQGKLIEHADQVPGLLIGHGGIDAEVILHLGDERGG